MPLINPNFPSNYKEEDRELDLSPILDSINSIKTIIANIEIPEVQDNIEVNNLDQIKLYLRQELSKAIKPIIDSITNITIPEPKDYPTELKVSNFPEVSYPSELKVNNLAEIQAYFNELADVIRTLNITIPEPNITVNPTPVNIASPIVNIEPININSIIDALDPLKYLSDRPDKPVTVRMSDGHKFVKALQQLKTSTDQLGVVYAGSSGISKDEYKAAERELYYSITATNTFSTVGVASSVVLAANATRISAIFSNDSDTTIYLALGSTAILNSGIRLNSSGGSLTISDYRGIVAAISSGASKNLCISEIY